MDTAENLLIYRPGLTPSTDIGQRALQLARVLKDNGRANSCNQGCLVLP